MRRRSFLQLAASTSAALTLPPWSEEQVIQYLHDAHGRYEQALPLGPYHHLLPLPLRRRTVVEQRGGALEFETRGADGTGETVTEFRFTLPLAPAPS